MTDEPVTLVRFHAPNRPVGRWYAQANEIFAKGPEEVRQLLALNRHPTHVSVAEIPAGVRIRKGAVKAQPEWGVPQDGGTQYQILIEEDLRKVEFSKQMPIEEWAQHGFP